VAEQAQRLAVTAGDGDAAQPGLTEDLRALALISLGSTEFRAFAWADAERHLESGIALARRIGRPYLPTNLTAPGIARELHVSPNTVRTHIKNLYAKLATRHPPQGRGRRARPRPQPARPLQNGAGDPLSARTQPVRGWSFVRLDPARRAAHPVELGA
jgi:hypothetical protein